MTFIKKRKKLCLGDSFPSLTPPMPLSRLWQAMAVGKFLSVPKDIKHTKDYMPGQSHKV